MSKGGLRQTAALDDPIGWVVVNVAIAIFDICLRLLELQLYHEWLPVLPPAAFLPEHIGMPVVQAGILRDLGAWPCRCASALTACAGDEHYLPIARVPRTAPGTAACGQELAVNAEGRAAEVDASKGVRSAGTLGETEERMRVVGATCAVGAYDESAPHSLGASEVGTKDLQLWEQKAHTAKVGANGLAINRATRGERGEIGPRQGKEGRWPLDGGSAQEEAGASFTMHRIALPASLKHIGLTEEPETQACC